MRQICKRGVIYPTMVCNINCEFCYYRYLKGKKHTPFDEVKSQLDMFKYYYNLEYVDITGGEPTVYPYIKEMVKYCSEINLKPTIITNAQKPQLISELIDLGLEDILISIHGLPEEHDKSVGKKGAFEKIIQTIEILRKQNFSFRTNTTITSYNIFSLPKLTKLLVEDLKPRIINFIMFNPHEGTLWCSKTDVEFQVKYSDASYYIKESIDFALRNNIWVNVRYIPLCIMNGYEKHVSNFHQWQYDPYEWEYCSSFNLTKEDIEEYIKKAKKLKIYGENDTEKLYNYLTKRLIKGQPISREKNLLKKMYNLLFHPIRLKHGNIFLLQCKKCMNFYICDGIYPQYVRRFGKEEFVPVNGPYIMDPIYYRLQNTRWAVMKQ